MSITSLPCVNCGVNLPITKGSTVQCFSCGTTNGYTESLDLLTDVLLDLFGYQGKFEEINDSVSKNTIQKRMLEIDKNFNKLLSESRQIDLIVITKLDSFLSEDTDIQKLRKHLGLLAIIIEQFLVPLLDNDLQAQQYNEMISLLKIRNIQLSGLIFTQKAKDAYQVDDSQSFYYQAQKNFAQAKNYAQEFAKEYHVDFQSEESLSDCAEKFCALLEDFTTNNPAYFADELEELELKLKDLTDARAITLKKQVITFYNLGTSLMFLLEEMREKKPFKALKIQYERIPFYTQEIKEDFYAAKRWLSNIEERFRDYQKDLMKIHCGKVTPYLEGFRKEFQRRHSEARQNFDDLISQYVHTTLSDFALEVDDDFELVDILIEGEHFNPGEVVERFENIKFNIGALEETIKSFLFNLMDESFDSDLKNIHMKDVVEGISERHAVFDKKVNKFLNNYIEMFIEKRNKETLPLEKQKELFNNDYLPQIKALVETSYTLEMEELPLPLFMELIILTRNLEIDVENRVVLLIENSSSRTLTNVGVTFFVPNSFMIKRRIVKVGKLKPYEKINIDSAFVPTEEGKFKIMAMVNYNHVNDSFWMPSIQIPIVVGNPEEQEKKLKELYKKHGIDISDVEKIKNMEEDEYKKEFEDLTGKYPYLAKIPDGTVEKDHLISVLREVEDLETEVKKDSYYEEEPYKDVQDTQEKEIGKQEKQNKK